MEPALQPLQIEGVSAASPNRSSTMTEVIVPAHFWQIPDFLPSEDLEALLDYVMQRDPDFQPSQTYQADTPDLRRSWVLHNFPEFAEPMQNLVELMLPEVLEALRFPEFPLGRVEAQLTAHNDGNYYQMHNDRGGTKNPDGSTTYERIITYVYYFNREPKAFSGGELWIYDCKLENGAYVPAESYQVVEPLNNSIVFFQSGYAHEVRPVSCPSQAFADSRFTINGWVRSA